MRCQADIDDWIRIAVNKGIKELILDFSERDPLEPEPVQLNRQYMLPNFLYQNATFIRVLNVSSCRLGFASFASMRSMSLTHVQICWKAMTHMVLICHLLESLGLVKVYLPNNDWRLKKLIVKNCEPLSPRLELSLLILEYISELVKLINSI
ncbi:hypothetical protein Dsin_009694 [Dipteronia sinensis]|uniref:F-box/LRR-repeat protein 15/At3g58940/PEG3-like LRR domain-containing protein n=1 Tax=Dipteronia sinensis TaxID=43782 RepID=A0AAE0EC62_9ROSI|nr:hypothetical protein Dsin_009694 [Dipteronia sinensis]